MSEVREAPPRMFWFVTVGRRTRVVRCPYLVPLREGQSKRDYRRPLVEGDPDWPDSYLAVTQRLSLLEWEGLIPSFRVTPVSPERVAAMKPRSRRWREIEPELVVAA